MAYFTLPADYATRARRLERDGLAVTLPDGSEYRVRQLLTEQDDNVKLAKSGKANAGFYTVGLSLAPYTMAGVGNLCAKASPQCVALCLNTAGKGLVQDKSGRYTVQAARIAKSRVAFSRDAEVRADFISLLVFQLERAERKARRYGLRLAVRLNVLSDMPWERLAPWLFTRFADAQFYDYTKVSARLGTTPGNYDLTFSRSETNEPEALEALRAGFRVAVVFSHKAPFPAEWRGFPVVDADAHDLRFTDGPAVVSALKAKGKARNTAGFVVC